MAAQARRGTIKSWVLSVLVKRGAIIKSGIRIAVCLLAVGCVKVRVQQMDQVVRPPRSRCFYLMMHPERLSGQPSTKQLGEGCPSAVVEGIAEWRSYLRRRPAIHAVDADELEDHLRSQASALVAAGLSGRRSTKKIFL